MRLTYCLPLLPFALLISDAATVSYWDFEEGSSGSTPSGAGVITDTVGTSNGTPAGTFAYSSSVPVSTIPLTGAPNTLSLAFDGASVVESPSPAFMNVAGAAFTVEFWMRRDSTPPSGQELLVDKSHGFGDSTGWFFQSNGTTIGFGIGNGSSFPGVASTVGLFDNAWHHLAGTYDGNIVEFFVDGVSQGTIIAGTSAANTRDIEFGRARNGGRFFNGDLDEVRISNTVLTPSEFLIVPEPSTSVLLLICSALGFVRRRS